MAGLYKLTEEMVSPMECSQLATQSQAAEGEWYKGLSQQWWPVILEGGNNAEPMSELSRSPLAPMHPPFHHVTLSASNEKAEENQAATW